MSVLIGSLQFISLSFDYRALFYCPSLTFGLKGSNSISSPTEEYMAHVRGVHSFIGSEVTHPQQ